MEKAQNKIMKEDNILVIANFEIPLERYEFILISILKKHNQMFIQTKINRVYNDIAKTLMERINFFTRVKKEEFKKKITPPNKDYQIFINEYCIERVDSIQDENLNNHG